MPDDNKPKPRGCGKCNNQSANPPKPGEVRVWDLRNRPEIDLQIPYHERLD